MECNSTTLALELVALAPAAAEWANQPVKSQTLSNHYKKRDNCFKKVDNNGNQYYKRKRIKWLDKTHTKKLSKNSLIIINDHLHLHNSRKTITNPLKSNLTIYQTFSSLKSHKTLTNPMKSTTILVVRAQIILKQKGHH